MESQFGAYVKQEKIGCRRFRVLIEQSLFLYVVSVRASFSVLFSAGGNFRLLYWGLLKGVCGEKALNHFNQNGGRGVVSREKKCEKWTNYLSGSNCLNPPENRGWFLTVLECLRGNFPASALMKGTLTALKGTSRVPYLCPRSRTCKFIIAENPLLLRCSAIHFMNPIFQHRHVPLPPLAGL